MKKFDVVIIGSGMGGLISGNILAKEGYAVCIIEKNKQLGGCLQIYARDKVIFDSGVHYLGGLDAGQNLYQIFKYLGVMDKLKLEKMDPAFDRILISGDEKEYVLLQGYEAFEKQLITDFPAETEAIQAYTKTIREICDRFPLYRLLVQGNGEEKTAAMETSAKVFIDSLTKNKTLRAVLAGNNMLYAGSGDATPLYVHALTVNSYMESAWRLLQGGSQIAKLLAKNIQASGGTILRNKKVQRLIMENNLVKAAELSDGTTINASHFISNTTPENTFAMTDSALIRPVTRKRVNDMPNTISSFILNIVFKKNRFPYHKFNYYYQQGSPWEMTSYDQSNWPLGYAVYFSPDAHSGFASGMTIFAYMKFEEVAPWAGSFNTISAKQDRGVGYEEFKKEKESKLLDRVEERFPGLRNHILRTYSSTPLTFRDYIGNKDGNLYGKIKDYRYPLGTLMSAKTRIPNLYLTGQSLNLHGILGTAISGLITSMAVLDKEDFIEKIKNA